jgi:hypothetical protein
VLAKALRLFEAIILHIDSATLPRNVVLSNTSQLKVQTARIIAKHPIAWSETNGDMKAGVC